jgi:hypothetical protein
MLHLLSYLCFVINCINNFNLVNLALNKTARQSDVQGGRFAALAVDGGLSQHMMAGSCTHTSARADAFWEVDLGKAYFINHVIIYNRGDCCSKSLFFSFIYIFAT